MRVLVSGAGIAGCTVAWHLARLGPHVTVEVVEKRPEAMLAQGQNIDISSSARTVIERMGLTSAVKACNTTEKGTRFINQYGRVFADFPVKHEEGGSRISPTSEFEILRGDLAELLYRATCELPNVRFRFSTFVEDVLSNDERSVRVTLQTTAQTDTATATTHEYDVLIAADGQWSAVRTQVFPQSSITVVDKNLYCAYWTAPRVAEDNDQWNVYQALGSRGMSVRPDPYGTVRVSFTRMPCNEQQKQAWGQAARAGREKQQALIASEFADAGWQAARFINSMTAAPDFYFQTISQIRMKHWSQQRVVCLGDTAYAPSPLTGMGTSLALQGAYVLAGELSELQEGDKPVRAFSAYERKLRAHVETTQSLPFFVPAIAHPASAWKRWLLHRLLQVGAAVMQYEWLVQTLSKLFQSEGFALPEYPKLESCTGSSAQAHTEDKH